MAAVFLSKNTYMFFTIASTAIKTPQRVPCPCVTPFPFA
jgi:hypothetical protein